MPPSFLFLTASARVGGNSESLARAAAAALPAGTATEWRDLTQADLPRFADLRHGGGPYGPPEGAAAGLCAATLAASDLVFVAPLYWYGLPAPAKLYLDHWSHWMRVEDLGFKAAMATKTLWLVMAHSGARPDQIAPAVDTLRLTADYLGMRWGGALLGEANAPGDMSKDGAAVERAKTFFAG